MNPGTILLVEDNPITRKMLRVTLEFEGYQVLDAGDGKTALELAADRQLDLLILDYVLPDMDGLQLLAELRRQLDGPDLPVIIITGMLSRLEELRMRSGGTAQLLAKPVEPSQLLELVRAQLAPAAVRAGGQKVLVVDDEPLNLKLAGFRLKRAGYEVETAGGGEAALALLHRWRPHAILSDVMMPAMDGFSFCREVRRQLDFDGIPIVLVSSAYVDEADRELARQMGANALVVRTPDLQDALAAVDAALQDAAPTPPIATGDQGSALHRERLQVQLERQNSRNETLLRQAAIQATALSVIRGLAEVLAQPRDVTEILGDVLVHCLDAAGLSTGLLYMAEPGGERRLQALFGVPAERRADAEAVYGHPQLLRRVVAAGVPFALSAGAADSDPECRDFIARLGHSSVLVLPFLVLGETFGELVLASDDHDLSDHGWIGFARSLALQFGQTVALGQSLKRLAGSESRYRALMEQANDAIFVLDQKGKILEANQRSEALLGVPRERFLGQHIAAFAPLPEAETPANVAQFEQTVGGGGGHVDSVTLRRGDGELVEVDFSMSLNEIDGKATVLSIGRDVTDRRRADRDLRERMALAAFAADVGAALVRTEPLAAVLQRCAEAMTRHLEPAFARIWTLDEAGETLELQASAGLYTHLDGAHARVPVGQFKIGLIAAERQPHLSNDVQHDPRVSDHEWARREGMVAFAGYPLVVGERVVGVMAMFARHPLSPTALDAMASVANQIALGIERYRAERALRETQDRLQQVLSSSPAVLYTLRVDGDRVAPKWTSANIERLSGYTPEEAGRDFWLERIHPEDRDRVTAEALDVLANGAGIREYRFRHRDGGYRWIRDEQILIHHANEADEVVGSWFDITERKEAEFQLHESEEQYRLLFEHNPSPMWVFDVESLAFLAVNAAAIGHYGWTREEFLGMRLTEIRPPEVLPAFLQDIEEVREQPERHNRSVWRHRKKDGTEIDVEVAATSITFEGRRARLTMATDVTERTVLQAQLLRAQKMEAVGQLAGGIAHDFNNLLGVITGYSELLIKNAPPDSRERKRGEGIKAAADRAAALTRQLLAFGRRQILQPTVLDLSVVVADVEKMLRRVISENIRIVTKSAPDLGRVRADAGQLEQVIMNLAVNARDAMSLGGTLLIETVNVELDDAYVRTRPEARPGDYVLLAVSDTGHGMDAKTAARIFEPFFTTKDEGKGTGLGLATVYGIVRQSGGLIDVYSEPGQGSRFQIYLPRVAQPAELKAPSEVEPVPGGTETILVVEDAEALRLLVRELLEGAGYTVLDADGPEHALALAQSTPGPIDLVLTDMVMPNMSGQDLAARLSQLRPQARVVFMSGYSERAINDQGTLTPGTNFLQKPFTLDALLRTMRRALDA